jgi:hypothetical protein
MGFLVVITPIPQSIEPTKTTVSMSKLKPKVKASLKRNKVFINYYISNSH